MSNEVTFNESYTLYEQKLKMLRLLEIILFYVHSKMVAMETIILYPGSICRYIGELQLLIFNISNNILNISHNLSMFWCYSQRCYVRNLKCRFLPDLSKICQKWTKIHTNRVS